MHLPKTAACLIALAALAMGTAGCLLHPLSPTVALAAFFCTLVLLVFQPRLWLFLLPAALPVLNFMPWSGWLMVDEFDLLVLCVLAAGYGRIAWQASAAKPEAGQVSKPVEVPHLRPNAGRGARTLITLFAVLSLVSVWRGFGANGLGDALAQVRETGLAQDYSGPLNSLRLVKSLLWALLCLPLLRRDMASAEGAARVFKMVAAGMLAGLSLVVLVVLWERLAYPGLFNFSTRYRTTAMFWEMHVGGASIDAYFALATPFVVWALARSRTWRHWLPLALLAVLTCYAVLTTFSRGVYVAVAAPLILLALGRWAQRFGLDWRQPLGQLWRRRASFWLVALLGLEVALVAAGGTFLADRMAQSQDDLDDRMAHWRRGVSLLHSPADWLLGIGLGRFPATYAQLGPQTEFSGALALMREIPDAPQFQAVPPLSVTQNFVRLAGPQSEPEIGGLFMLNQRVNVPVAQWLKQAPAARPSAGYTVVLEARLSGRSRVMFKVCEKHLLYEGECLARYVTLQGGLDWSNPAGALGAMGALGAIGAQGSWQRLSLSLRGAGLQLDEAVLPRSAVLSVAVFEPGVHMDIRQLQLIDPTGQPLVANADFSRGTAHWFPSAGSYYLPWHVDNLYLELLIERGLAGLLLFIMLIGAILVRLAGAQANERSEAAMVSAALLGALLLGMVSSVLDTPRVAFLLFFLIFLGNQLTIAKSRNGSTP
jgi:energy-coupling factor transporter transmembrane protein EcfT